MNNLDLIYSFKVGIQDYTNTNIKTDDTSDRLNQVFNYLHMYLKLPKLNKILDLEVAASDLTKSLDGLEKRGKITFIEMELLSLSLKVLRDANFKIDVKIEEFVKKKFTEVFKSYVDELKQSNDLKEDREIFKIKNVFDLTNYFNTTEKEIITQNIVDDLIKLDVEKNLPKLARIVSEVTGFLIPSSVSLDKNFDDESHPEELEMSVQDNHSPFEFRPSPENLRLSPLDERSPKRLKMDHLEFDTLVAAKPSKKKQGESLTGKSSKVKLTEDFHEKLKAYILNNPLKLDSEKYTKCENDAVKKHYQPTIHRDGNKNHLELYYHHESQRYIIICKKILMYRVKRPGKIKFEGFNRLTSGIKKGRITALDPIIDYAQSCTANKAERDSFPSQFIVMYSNPDWPYSANPEFKKRETAKNDKESPEQSFIEVPDQE